MEGPPLGPGGEDITWPDQVAPRGRKASSTRKIKPQTSNPGGPEEPTDADPCSDTEKSFRTENDPAALQPRDELYEGRAGPAGADSLEGNGGRGALWL